MAKKTLKLDKYAQDARAWKAWGDHNYAASSYLFQSHQPILIFAAATLGHYALEMYLKAALICQGCTVFDPKNLKALDPPMKLQRANCAWGHNLVPLARKLATRQPNFDLRARMKVFVRPWRKGGGLVTVQQAFALFDPFFFELRYPQQLTMGGVGEDDRLPLDELVERLKPFLPEIRYGVSEL